MAEASGAVRWTEGQADAAERLVGAAWTASAADIQSGRHDVTAALASAGADIQGVPFHQVRRGRVSNWRSRQRTVRSFRNRDENDDDLLDPNVDPLVVPPRPRRRGTLFRLHGTFRRAASHNFHFQLRNCVWASSQLDVVHLGLRSVNLWSVVSRVDRELLPYVGEQWRQRRGHIIPCSLCVADGWVVLGGQDGELAVWSMREQSMLFNGVMTTEPDAIVNAVTPGGGAGSSALVVSNNDHRVRFIDRETFAVRDRIDLGSAVNHTSVSPHNPYRFVSVCDDTAAVVGDVRAGVDEGDVVKLHGHRDFGFSTAWHPRCEHTVATGNQDRSVRLWDLRQPSEAVHVLPMELGSASALQYSSDGQLLLVGESADWVHLVDTSDTSTLFVRQSFDFFGSLSGCCFSPDDRWVHVGISDRDFPSLMSLQRWHSESLEDALLL